MDRGTVFTKTAKGITQVNQRSASLPKDLMKVLKLIDGKSNFGQLLERADLDKAPLEIALTKLTKDGFARVFETRKDELDFGGGADDDFDFTSPKKQGAAHPGTTQRVVASAANDIGELARQQERTDGDRKSREEGERKAREESERKARAAHEAARVKAKAEAEARAKLEAEARAKQEAEERAMEQARRAKEAAERAKAEVEAQLREEETRRRALAEQQARLTAEQKVREEAESRRLAELRARAEAEAKALAEARARAEAEARALAQARAEAEVAARRQAQEASTAEHELRARLKEEIESRIRAEMEELLRNEIEEKARADMQAQIMEEAKLAARAELEERLREEREALAVAEREARGRAEKDARERADREAKLRAEAEARATAEAEARMKAEAEVRRARQEAEERAREQAETVRHLEEERRAKMEAEARAIVQAQERERRERELSAEMQERDKRERELSAEVLEREKRERELSAEVLEREKRERELSAEVLERERRERELSAEVQERQKREKALSAAIVAERRAKETIAEDVRVQVQAELEADLEKRAQIEGKAQAKAYMQAKAKAEEDEEQRLRDEQSRKAREIADILRTKSEAEPDAPAAQKPVRRRGRRAGGLLKTALYGIAILFIVAVGLLHVVPLRPYAAKLERAMSAWLHDDVSIGSATFRLWPTPHLNVENIAVGKLLDAKAVKGRIYVDIATLLGDQPAINALEFEDVSIASSAVKRIPLWAQEEGKDRAGGIDSITLRGVKLDVKPELVPFAASLQFSRKGQLREASITSSGGWTARVKPGEGGADVEINARGTTLPVGMPIAVADATIRGRIADNALVAREFEAAAFGGKVTGSFKVTWGGPNVRFESDLVMQRVNAQELLSTFTRDIAVTGRLDGEFKVASESAAPEALFAAPHVQGKFRLVEGSISNVDLVAVMQSTDTAQRAGVTKFAELTGEYGAAERRSSFRQVNLQGGVLRGNGTFEVSPTSALNGRATLEIRSQVAQDRGAFAVSGTVSRPVIRRGG